MTEEQKNDLSHIMGDVEVEQIDKTIRDISEISNEIERSDIICVVMPLELQAELYKKISGTGKRLLVPVSHRVPNGFGSYVFVHAGWSEVKVLIISTERLTSYPAPDGAIR
jgi:hypothetical protein